ncbi:hypothetical protein OCV73_00035 [Barnesiella propionica]|uniref:hypothetical protein n=1 Tax=Barnesiella propionica TaxID=2981781 RepID=UPI0011C82F57|nr:hypothetical protein [Barnesiella propionica]MCU6767350.1 hypothetical protein [Barnesiella propionica]
MKEITLIVNRASVYDEVAKTTSYTGAKMQNEDETAYNRIFTTDEDQQMLERFWIEACHIATDNFKPFIMHVSKYTESDYIVKLKLSSSFDENLNATTESSLFSFFVVTIVAKWYQFTNKGETEYYTNYATKLMTDVMRKIYWKKKPKRIAPTKK